MRALPWILAAAIAVLTLLPFAQVWGQGPGSYSGAITNDQPYQIIDLPDVPDGASIVIDVEATSGDLDPVAVLFFENDIWAAENDDRSPTDSNPYIKYESAPGGSYYVVITRYGVEEGETSGEFSALVVVSTAAAAPLSSVNSETIIDLDAAGYPDLPVQPEAEWTVLAYLGADNNLEAGLLYDLDEMERAGGSDETVRVLALIDRAEGYDESNGNWADTRLYEVSADKSGDAAVRYPPTLDSRVLANLGESDTSDPMTLLEFLVWGMTYYPAQHYAVVINDHGGAWAGTVTDDETGSGEIMTLPELHSAFARALSLTGVDGFDLLVNDACLMSSIEFFSTIQHDFGTVFSSPEIMNNPGFDMTLFIRSLRENPGVALADLGEAMAGKYMADMRLGFPGIEPFMGVAVTDLTQFGKLLNALNEFSALVDRKPEAYAPFLGRVRSNTYTYSTWAGSSDQIDLGNFMERIASATTDDLMQTAANNVLQAIDDALLYSTAGETLGPETSYYNIFFPMGTSTFNPRYVQQSPLAGWNRMLRVYFSTLLEAPYGRDAFSGAPQVNITNVFPATASIYAPVTVGMEVEGNNISFGDFTVDYIQPDGSAIRLRQARILTEVVNDDDSVEYLNVWNPGVDDSRFTWYVRLPQVTDGVTTNFENVTLNNTLASLVGRYHFPGSEQWMDVSVLFNDDGTYSSMISRQADSQAFANILPEAGGEFQAYQAVVTPDGALEYQPGNLYAWPEGGLSWHNAPAPTGEYNLGFLVQGFTGETGFNSVQVSVNNDRIDERLRGYVDLDWGFNLVYPLDYYDLIYYPSSGWEEASSADGSDLLYVYPVYDVPNELETVASEGLGQYGVDVDTASFSPLTVDGLDALEFTYSFEGDAGVFNGRAFAVYRPELEMGLVFAFETLEGRDLGKMYGVLRDNLRFFDATEVSAADTGVWRRDYGPTASYPVLGDWLDSAQDKDGWRIYTGSDGAFLSVSEREGEQPASVLGSLLIEYVPDSDFEQLARDAYYGEAQTWQNAFYRRYDGATPIVGGMFVTVSNGTAHTIWFEMPEADVETLLSAIYVTIDGYALD